jgi:hypothetical protein
MAFAKSKHKIKTAKGLIKQNVRVLTTLPQNLREAHSNDASRQRQVKAQLSP